MFVGQQSRPRPLRRHASVEQDLPIYGACGSVLERLCCSRPSSPPSGTARVQSASITRKLGGSGLTDAEADMPLAEASGAICVQRFDDSRNSAIHTTYRISLRSSSLREPRYPLLRVVIGLLMSLGVPASQPIMFTREDSVVDAFRRPWVL